jgi:hypothetical protein
MLRRSKIKPKHNSDPSELSPDLVVYFWQFADNVEINLPAADTSLATLSAL